MDAHGGALAQNFGHFQPRNYKEPFGFLHFGGIKIYIMD
jgi:hypothetical protein